MKAPAAILVALLLVPSPAEAWVYYTSESSGETVRWKSGGPCSIAFQYNPAGIESIPGMQEFTLFEDAMDLWNANPCTDIRLILDGVDGGCEVHKPAFPGEEQNCIVVSPSGWALAHPDYNGAAMLTVLNYLPSTGYLGDVDIDINEDGFDFGLDTEGVDPDDVVDYRFAVAHELGHVYGLAHSEDPDSILYSDGDIYLADDNPLEPQQDDLDGVCAVYDRTLFSCSDAPPEPEPEADSEIGPDLVIEPNPEPFEVEGGGPKESCCCDMGSRSDLGSGLLLFLLVLPLALRRRRIA
ncbi:MAG: matrixin family metalloprotease [Pseudomonadota bacterium]